MKTIFKYLLFTSAVFLFTEDIYSQVFIPKIDSSVTKMMMPIKINPSLYLYQDNNNINELLIKNEGIGNKSTVESCGYYMGDIIAFPMYFGFTDVYSPDVQVSVNSPSGCEISVCVDPINKDIVKEVNMSVDQHCINYYFSGDKGISWDGSCLPFEYVSSDPTLVINNSGTCFVSYLQNNEHLAIDECTASSVELGIYDDINGWQGPVDVRVPSNYDYNLDKPHLAVDNSVNNGNLYCAWTPMACGSTIPPECNDLGIEISRSTNNGISWDSPILVSQSIYPDPDLTVNQGVNIQTGPYGEVYAVWAVIDWETSNGRPSLTDPRDETGLVFVRSLDQGVTYDGNDGFGVLIKTIHGIAGYKKEVPGWNFTNSNRINSFPSMCVDNSGGPRNGRIYIVWANHGPIDVPDYNGILINVYMIYSDNQGDLNSWSDPIMINQVSEDDRAFFPWISCDTETGVLSVTYYNTYGDDLIACTAMSKDYGEHWETSWVGDYIFRGPIENFFGDYIGNCSKNGIIYPTFTDTRAPDIHDDCLPQVFISPYYAWNCVCDYQNVTEPVSAYNIREWEVSQNINVRNIIYATGLAVFNAGFEIMLLPSPEPYNPDEGFHAQDGSFVHAYIEGCEPFEPNSFELKSVQQKEILEIRNQGPVEPKIKIFPNPCPGNFQIDLADANIQNCHVEIINSLGTLIFSSQFINKSILKIDISNYPKGVYLIKLFDKTQTYTYKIAYL